MQNIHDVCDYLIIKLRDGGVFLNFLKLHKLLYYLQAWNLAFGRGRLFDEKFQAWVHGPVSRQVYDRFKDTKTLYSSVDRADMRSTFDPTVITDADRATIDSILETYADFSGDQLEEMTHQEDPWINARRGYGPAERCEVEISESDMRQYYSARLEHAQTA